MQITSPAGCRTPSWCEPLALAGLMTGPPAATAQVPAASKPAIFHNRRWYLGNSLTTGGATSTFRYGQQGDIPVTGDWDGNGTDTVGVVRITEVVGGDLAYTWFLRNTNSAGSATVAPFSFGEVRFVAVDQLGSIPVVGDWNGERGRHGGGRPTTASPPASATRRPGSTPCCAWSTRTRSPTTP